MHNLGTITNLGKTFSLPQKVLSGPFAANLFPPPDTQKVNEYNEFSSPITRTQSRYYNKETSYLIHQTKYTGEKDYNKAVLSMSHASLSPCSTITGTI